MIVALALLGTSRRQPLYADAPVPGALTLPYRVFCAVHRGTGTIEVVAKSATRLGCICFFMRGACVACCLLYVT